MKLAQVFKKKDLDETNYRAVRKNNAKSNEWLFNPFLANVPILYQKFSGVFREYKIETLAKNGLSNFFDPTYVVTEKVVTHSKHCKHLFQNGKII